MEQMVFETGMLEIWWFQIFSVISFTNPSVSHHLMNFFRGKVGGGGSHFLTGQFFLFLNADN